VIRSGSDYAQECMSKAILAFALAAVLLSGCGGEDASGGSGGGASGDPKPTETIRISEYLYKPEPAAVRVGRKVSVVNEDDAPHTVTDKAERRAFDSGTIKGDARGSVTFSAAGTYSYFCEFHPTMRGSVTVSK